MLSAAYLLKQVGVRIKRDLNRVAWRFKNFLKQFERTVVKPGFLRLRQSLCSPNVTSFSIVTTSMRTAAVNFDFGLG